MTTLNDWDNAPSPAGDPTLHAHKLGLHDVPEDDCPACRADRGCICGPRASDPEHGCTCGYADWMGER